MSKLFRALALLPVFTLASCGGGGDDSVDVQTAPLETPDPHRDYLIGFGEAVYFDGLAVEFTAVAEDSRCPNNPLALCVWEGNARILLTATRGNVTGVIELNTNPRFPVVAPFEGHTLILRGLDPYPGVTPIPVQTYEATVSIIRSAP